MKRQLRQFGGFTIAELVVAVAVMALVLTGTGYIFKVAIDMQRMAGATSEIMRNLRGITDQIDSDFRGLQTDAPLVVWFQHDGVSTTADPNRFDEIMFFAAGDFSSYRNNYGIDSSAGSDVLKGNAARIWYGHADSNDPKNKPSPIYDIRQPEKLPRAARILARNQHILNPNPNYTGTANWPDISFSGFNLTVNGMRANEYYEYDTLSLAQWKAISFANFRSPVVQNTFGDDLPPNNQRPIVTVSDPCTFNNLMCKGVGSFAVQWGYWYVNGTAKEWRWWPSGTGGDFTRMASPFGVYFNVDRAKRNEFR